MASIGAVACSKVVGNPLPQAEQMETFRIMGIDGIGVHLLGKGGGEWSATVVLYAAPAFVTAWHSSLVSLQGQLVTVVNDWGVAFGPCLVQSVSALQRRPAIGEGGCRGECSVSLISMA